MNVTSQTFMPFTIDRYEEGDAVVVRWHGAETAGDWNAALTALEDVCRGREASAAIIDLSEVSYVPTPDDVRAFARGFSRLRGQLECMIAVVGRQGAQFGMARMIEALLSVDRVKASAFTSLEDAIKWIEGE